jgi:hypothetical protein
MIEYRGYDRILNGAAVGTVVAVGEGEELAWPWSTVQYSTVQLRDLQ